MTAETFPQTNGRREGVSVLGIDRISGMVGMGRLADGPLFTFAVFPECGPHEQYSKDEYGSGRKMTDGGVEVAVDPVECELSDQYRQADHENEV